MGWRETEEKDSGNNQSTEKIKLKERLWERTRDTGDIGPDVAFQAMEY